MPCRRHLDEVCVYHIRILIVHTLVCRLLGKATFDALNNRHMSGHCADGASAVDLRPTPMKAPREKGRLRRGWPESPGRPSAHPDPGTRCRTPPKPQEQDPLFIHVWSNFCYSYFGRCVPQTCNGINEEPSKLWSDKLRRTYFVKPHGKLRFGFVPMMSELVAVISAVPTRTGPLS